MSPECTVSLEACVCDLLSTLKFDVFYTQVYLHLEAYVCICVCVWGCACVCFHLNIV